MDVLGFNNKTSNTVVAIRNDFSQARCTNRYIAVDNVDDDENVCDSQRVRLRRGLLLPAFIEWTVKSIKNSECFNIISRDRDVGCSRYLSAHADCERRHLRLARRDDGSGLQRWRFVPVGGVAPSPGSSCASTGPVNCAECCKSKFEEFDGSYLDDRSCLDTKQYPQCDFEFPPTPKCPVTVTCPGIAVGATLTLSCGVTYTKRDRAGLLSLVGTANQAELATSCTTGVTDMSDMFNNATAFDVDVSSWDTSLVTNMSHMFYVRFPALYFLAVACPLDVSTLTPHGHLSLLYCRAPLHSTSPSVTGRRAR